MGKRLMVGGEIIFARVLKSVPLLINKNMGGYLRVYPRLRVHSASLRSRLRSRCRLRLRFATVSGRLFSVVLFLFKTNPKTKLNT